MRTDLALEASHKIVFQKKGRTKKTQFMERLKNWGSQQKKLFFECKKSQCLERLKNWGSAGSQKKEKFNFLNAGNPNAWSFSKLEFQKKRNSNFLNAEKPSSWSFSKIRVPKKKEL